MEKRARRRENLAAIKTMHVDIIDDFKDFEAVKPNWERVYAADRDANLFLSWTWLSKWLREVKTDWLVLAAKPNRAAKNYVGFFPLRLNARPAKQGGFYTEVLLAGTRFADYTGIVLEPDYAEAAIDAFAEHVNGMNWGLLQFNSMRVQEAHHERLIRHFPRTHFDVLLDRPVLDSAGVDNSICPFVPLPHSWDAYLMTLSANARQKLRRLLRRLDADPDLRISLADRKTARQSIETLIDFWSSQWSARKGENLRALQNNLRTMLNHYADLGILYMPILWKGPDPVGVLASLIDWRKRSMHFFIGARDHTFSNPQPGLTLHAHSIRAAIDMGLSRYDFLRGNERYKYSFGSTERQIFNTLIRVKSKPGKRPLLDVRSIPKALALAKRQAAEGERAKAETGYRQILSLDPTCLNAALGLAELRRVRGSLVGTECTVRWIL